MTLWSLSIVSWSQTLSTEDHKLPPTDCVSGPGPDGKSQCAATIDRINEVLKGLNHKKLSFSMLKSHNSWPLCQGSFPPKLEKKDKKKHFSPNSRDSVCLRIGDLKRKVYLTKQSTHCDLFSHSPHVYVRFLGVEVQKDLSSVAFSTLVSFSL